VNAHARFLVGFDGTSVPSELRAFLAAGSPAGVVLFGRNIVSTEQVAELTADLAALWPADGPPPLICVDQEGGPVQRLKPPQCPEFDRVPAMRDIVATHDLVAIEALGARMGSQLAATGFNVDFAPVLDVDTNPANPIIAERAFGTTPAEVAERALAFARGLSRGGVLGCGKHFPGHGDTALDSHLALPVVAHDRARLEAIELPPFRAAVAADIPMLMTAHILMPALDPIWPATLSPRIIPELLRAQWGYDGVVVSDDLEMKAVFDRYSVDEIAHGCVDADVDVLLVCRDLAYATELSAAVAAYQTDGQRQRAERRIRTLRDRAATLRVW
jgi:beta-N-acetylhexosaminidase